VNVTTNVTPEGNSNFVQNLSETNVNITYNEIRKEIDRVISNESEEIKNIVKEIINEINSKRIPHSNLEKLKSISKEIYDKFSPLALKLMEIVSKTGFFNT
jgi:gas vesicle protein